MSRLDDARKRLEQAVDRLEAAVEANLRSPEPDEKTLEALHRARSDYAALKQVTENVRGRLDTTIHRLENMLDA